MPSRACPVRRSRALRIVAWIVAALALLPLAGPPRHADAEAAEPLVRFTFDRGQDSWVEMTGSDVLVDFDRGRGIPKEGIGCLRFTFRRSDGETPRGVSSPPLQLGKKHDGPVLFRFWIRSDLVRSFVLEARNQKEESYSAGFQIPVGSWTSVTFSSDALAGAKGDGLDPRTLRDVSIWCWGPPKVKEVVVWIDDFRIEALSGTEEPGPRGGSDATLEAVSPHPQFGAALDYATLLAAVEDDGGVADLNAAVQRATRLGFGLMQTPKAAWSDLELSRTVFAWRSLDLLADAARAAGIGIVASLGTILDPSREDPVCNPVDLQARDFQDLWPRYQRFLDLYFERYGDVIRMAVLRTERCAPYFESNPQRLRSYREFLQSAAAHWKKIAPGVPLSLGVDFLDSPKLVHLLAEGVDRLAVGFDPSATHVHPRYLREEVVKLLALCAGRKVALMETGFPSSQMVDSSEERQAQFVRELFDALQLSRTTLEWITWWSLRDDEPSLWTGDRRAIRTPGATAHWLRGRASCGLLRRDFSAKPAAAAWVQIVKTLRR